MPGVLDDECSSAEPLPAAKVGSELRMDAMRAARLDSGSSSSPFGHQIEAAKSIQGPSPFLPQAVRATVPGRELV
jgi:hypothetical protein